MLGRLLLRTSGAASRACSLRTSSGALASRSVCSASALFSPIGASTSSARAFSADSHSDFAPKTKVSQDDPAKLKAQVDQLVKSHPVVLFMKGTPQQPMCGFSMRVAQLLHAEGVDIHGVDILSNATLRTYMKEYSSWPTFPQLYVGGDFVGGCDIATQMYQSGELQELLKKHAAAPTPAAAAASKQA